MRSAVVCFPVLVSKSIYERHHMLLTEIDTKKIPGEMNDRVKLHTYLSPGDLLVLWNSFKVACTLFSPEAAARPLRRLSASLFENDETTYLGGLV